MKRNLESSLHSLGAIVTWCVVFGLGCLLLRDASTPYSDRMTEFVVLQVAFLALMIATVIDQAKHGRRGRNYVFLAASIAIVFWLGCRFPISFLPIYSIMWITLLPLFFSTRVSSALLLLVITGWYLTQRFAWQEVDPLLDVLLFGTFHLFALFSSLTARRAEEATRRARELNRGLLATQQLLSDAAKENERTRIARDLHDQLGHNMTALAINLQVAGRLANGEVKQKVDQCHELSKQLLHDVRQSVSTLREQEPLDVAKSLQRLADNVPELEIHLEIETNLAISDVLAAEAIVRCVQEGVTNTLRHARASQSWIRLWQEQDFIHLHITDDGQSKPSARPGNGLRGMRERIEKLNGTMRTKSDSSFRIEIQFPRLMFT